MYKILHSACIFSSCLLLSTTVNTAMAQSCSPNGILTNPTNSVNNQVPQLRNLFDWGFTAAKPAYDVNWFFTGQRPYLETPYNQGSNPSSDVAFLQGAIDKPESGWELIKRDLGYTEGINSTPTPAGVHNPYVIIYNKYTGILRVFWAIGDRQSTFQYCTIELGFGDSSYNTASKSGLLNRVAGIGVPLENTYPGNGQVQTVQKIFPNTFGAWFMADFPMDYDPCTCLKQSTVQLRVKLIQQSDVRLSSSTTGSAYTPTINDKSRSILGGAVSGANTALSSTITSFNSAADFAKTFLEPSNNKVISDQFSKALTSSGFLKAGFQNLPYVGAAISLLDFFLGGGQDSGVQQVSMQPMAIDLQTTTTGTITTNSTYSGARFSTPGSQVRSQYLQEYPSYNEVLGVINLLKNPNVGQVRSGLNNAYPYREQSDYGTHFYAGSGGIVDNYYHLSEDLPYVVNPASGLRVKEMQACLMTTVQILDKNGLGDFNNIGPARKDYAGRTVNDVSTRFVDIGCLAGTVFDLPEYYPARQPDPNYDPYNYYPDSGSPAYFRTGGMYIKLMVNLERVNPTSTNQNTLIVLTYPVYDNIITSAAPNSDPGGEDPYPDDNLSLFGPLPSCTSTLTPPVSAAGISDFCQNNNNYKQAIALAKAPTGTSANITAASSPRSTHATSQALTQFDFYPNPVQGNGTISFAVTAPGQVKIYLVNELGQTVREFIDKPYAEGLYQIDVNTEGMAPGLYQCILQTANEKQIVRVAITR